MKKRQNTRRWVGKVKHKQHTPVLFYSSLVEIGSEAMSAFGKESVLSHKARAAAFESTLAFRHHATSSPQRGLRDDVPGIVERRIHR